jgi:rSAM/selenodomain-associated transferase 1
VALAVMAKVPVAGEVKTRLCPPLSLQQAAELARCFLLDRLDQVRGLEAVDALVAFAPPERTEEMRRLVPAGTRLVAQRGDDLGARLDALLSGLLAEGYQGVMAVDADSPTLPSAFLRDAASQLLGGDADVVVGPAEDGGYYLIGLRRPTPALFRDIPWSTASVLDTTCARARALGLRLRRLPTWFDVDRGEDLVRLVTPVTGPEGFRPPRTLAFVAGQGCAAARVARSGTA